MSNTSNSKMPVVVTIGFQILKGQPDFMKAFGNRLHLPGLLGIIDDSKAIVSYAAHPFLMPGDTGTPRFGYEHMMKNNIVGKNDDLPFLRRLFGKTFGDSLHPRVIKG